MLLRQSFSALFSQNKKYKSEIKRYILLLILPLILGIALFACVQSVISRQIEQTGNITAMHFQAQASGAIREMQLVSDSLLSDSKFMDDIRKDDYEDVDPLELCDIINSHLRESPYVRNAYVISQSHNHIYTDNGYYLYDGRTQLLSSIIASSVGSDASFELDMQLGWHILNSNYAPPYYVVSIPDANNSGEVATLVVTLNVREFLSTLYEANTELCCIFNDDFSVSSLLTNHSGVDWSSPEEVSELLDTNVRCFYIEDEFTYLTAISVKEYYAPLQTIIYVFCIYFAAVLIFGFIYLQAVSKRRYTEVAAIIDGLPHTLSENPSYEDIVVAIRTSLNDYRNQSDSERERRKRANLRILLSGSYARTLSPQELSEAGIIPSADGYYVALLHLKDAVGIVSSGSNSMNVDMTSLIFQSALSSIAEDNFHVAVTHLANNYSVVFSVNSHQASHEELRKVIESTAALMMQEYGAMLSATVSRRISDPAEFFDAYRESCNMYNFVHAVDSDICVLMQDDMAADTGVLLSGDYLNQLQTLSKTLSLEKYQYVPTMVDTILKDHVAGIRSHYALAADRIRSISTFLAEAVLSSKFPQEFTVKAAEQFRQVDSVSQLSTLTAEVFGKMTEHSAQSEDKDVVDKACKYIMYNLSNPNLSVPEICEVLDISIQHLSRLFRKKLNTTIVEYINTNRVDAAKKMLVEQNITIAKIAEKAGYNTALTFTRNFRRYVGLTPTEYRELNK